MDVNFVNPFLSSLMNVLSTMASTTLQPGKPRLKKDDVASGDVSGLIGMVGPQVKGSLSITFEQRLALWVMQQMLGENPGEVNDEVTDLVGEITNMVAGGAKNLLGERGFEFDMATPVVIAGEGHRVSHKSKGQKVIIPFTAEQGAVFIEICFD